MTYTAEVAADSPLYYYKLGEASGNAVNSGSQATQNLTVAAGVTRAVTGIPGGPDSAVTLNGGTTNYLTQASHNVSYASDDVFTVESWFKTTDTDATIVMWFVSPYWYMNISALGKLSFTAGTTGMTSSASVNDNAWHHGVAVINGTSHKLYLDGVEVATATGDPGTLSTNGVFYIGDNRSQFSLTGTVDEVAIYNSALSATRIRTHYLAGMNYADAGYTGQAMTADVAFPGGVKQNIINYSASPMTATAAMPTARGYGAATITPSRDVQANETTNPVTGNNSVSLTSGVGALFDFTLPNGFSDAGLVSATLRVYFDSRVAANTITVQPITAAWDTADVTHTFGTGFTQSVSAAAGYRDFDVSSLVSTSGFYGLRLLGDGNNRSVHMVESAEDPMLVLAYESVSTPGGYTAQPMTVDAIVVMPSVGIAEINAADPMTASGLMVDPIVAGTRTVNYTATPMTAAADMPAGAFAIQVNLSANPMTVAAEFVDADVETTIGVIANSEPFAATASWVKPALVNGSPIIVEEAEDAYFQRVFALAPKVWQRLNDVTSTAVDRMATYNGIYYGVDFGNYDGPDDRHSVHFDVGDYLEQTEPGGSNADEAQIQDGSAAATTVEFSFRTDKANAFLMAGADSTQTTAGVRSSYAARELFLSNGKLTFRSRIFAGTPDMVDKEFTGVRNLADGEWHHVVVKSGVYSRGEWATELWIDGTFEIRRFFTNGFMGFPDYIGFRPNYIDGSELETLPLSQGFEGDMTEVVFYNHNNLPNHDIARNYYAFMGWKPIAAESMDASATIVEAKGGGNQKKALYLYFNATDEVFQTGDGIEWSQSFDPMTGFVERAFQAPNVPFTYEERVGDYHGFKVFARSARINTDNTSYRDPLTDDPSLINLETDVDLADYDVILFKDWPDESDELDDITYNFPAQKDRLVSQLLDAVNDGKGLLVTNPRMAVDLGVIDRVEFVPTWKETKYSGAQGAAYGLYDYGSALKFPWNIAASDGLTGGNYAAGIGETQNLNASFLENKAYFYHDTNNNNRFRVRANVEGLTDLPSWMIADAVWHVDYDQYGWQGAAYKYLRREEGLSIGDEYIFNGSESIGAKWLDIAERRYHRFNGTWATPPGHVKAGTVVTTFGAKQWVGKAEVDNPYKNYATTIVVREGDTLNGQAVGGRIFVNFTEQPSYGLAVVSQTLPDGPTGWPEGYAVETTAQKEWDYSWTRTSLTVTGSEATETVTIALPNGEFQVIKIGGGGDSPELVMVRSGQLFPLEAHARLEMVSRGMYWLAAMVEEEEGAATVRSTPLTATAEMPTATVEARRSVVSGAQPMLALAVLATQGPSPDAAVSTLPMLAEASFSQYGQRVLASPFEATAELVEPFDPVHAGGEHIALILYQNVEAELYLKEES